MGNEKPGTPSTSDPVAEEDGTVDKDEMRYRFDFIAHVHDHVSESIRFADTKALIILTACGFLFALPLTRVEDMRRLMQDMGGGGSVLLFSSVVVVILYTSLVIAAVCCACCIFPRFSRKSWRSKVYFGDIAVSQTYVADIKGISSQEAIEELAADTQHISCIAVEKHKCIRGATIGLGVGVFSMLIVFLILYA